MRSSSREERPTYCRRSPNRCWTEPVLGQGIQVTEATRTIWLAPVLSEVQLGIGPGESWFAMSKRGIEPVEDPIPVLLPLMQPGYGGSVADVSLLLESRLESAGLDAESAATFPFAEVAKTGLAWPTDFWVVLALQWLSELPVSAELRSFLVRLVESERSQRCRHLAGRLLAESNEAEGRYLRFRQSKS